MAIDKSRTSPWVKIVLIVVAIAFVGSFIPLAAGLFTPQNNQSLDQTTSAGQATVDGINAKYAGGVQALQGAVASDPTSYTALVSLGNTYMDWGFELQGASQESSAAAAAIPPLFVGAKDSYAKALEIKKGDNAVEGDFAIALFYTGDTKGAIAVAQPVVKRDPNFAILWFNLGNFYAQDGQNDEAIKAYEKYVELEPQGQLVQNAQSAIAGLKGGQ